MNDIHNVLRSSPVPPIDTEMCGVVDARAKGLADTELQLPWWAGFMVRHRDHFKRTAIGVESDGDGVYLADFIILQAL